MTKTYHANAKLLLTGEYVVIDGARALVLPLNRGQTLKINYTRKHNKIISWKSYEMDELWFQCTIDKRKLNILTTDETGISRSVEKILKAIQKSESKVFKSGDTFEFEFFLDFNREWGWGSSSTLLSLLSQWSGIDAYELFFNLNNGSAYDIAAAKTNRPFLYSIRNRQPAVEEINFQPSFSKYLFFVYLGEKQASAIEVKAYNRLSRPGANLIAKISEISEKVAVCNNLGLFEQLLVEHEERLSVLLKRTPIKQQLFPGYKAGIVKPLGAWGGDFVLITCSSGKEYLEEYLKSKNLSLCFAYDEIVKNEKLI